jgi:ketosteroid isomerase-like protein
MEEVLARFADALARGDADVAANLFDEDAIYEEPPHFRFEGREAIHVFFRDFAARHSAARFIVLRSVTDPERSLLAAEWEWRYRSASDQQERAFAGMSFITFTGEQIKSWRGLSIPLET